MRIDHIGYAVKKIDQAIISFQQLGFNFGEKIEDLDRNILICFGENDGYRVELVQPLDKKQISPVDTVLSKAAMGGGKPYHICYVSDDLDSDISQLDSMGFKVVIPPQEAVAFGGNRVVFMVARGIGLLEIVEENANIE